MSELLEELDLTDLSETMYAPDPDMSEDDLKMLKIKHRGKEMKEIAEADKEYLKGIMEHNKDKNGAAGINIGKTVPITITGSNVTAPSVAVQGFDVSV